MVYEKQTWIDGESPLDAQRMNHMESGIAAAANEISSAAAELKKLYSGGETYNLFNVNSPDNVNGAFLHKDGSVISTAGYVYSHPIQVQPGKTYYVTLNPDLMADYIAAFYALNETVVSGGAPEKTEDGLFWKLIIPDAAVWMRINTDVNRMSSVMVVQSDTQPEEYVPYTASESGLVYEQGVKVDALSGESTLLRGKKLSVNGDSLCYGAGSTGGYGKLIADRCGMTLQNIAQSGATIAAETYASDGTTARHWICRTIENMDADADFVILEGGVNDAAENVSMGTLNLSNYTAALDETTFCGAFESMLKKAIVHFEKAKIFYLAVHKMATGFSSNASDNYYHNAIALCKKWGVPVIDLNVSVPPLGMYVEDANLVALREKYTHNGDGWHPNRAGYERYYLDAIIGAMKTL